MRLVVLIALFLASTAAWAQGGNIGEGPGWGILFLVLAAGSILIPGVLALVALLLFGRGRAVRRGWPIAGGFLVAIPAAVLSAFLGLMLNSFALYVLLLLGIEALYVLVFALVWRRRPRS